MISVDFGGIKSILKIGIPGVGRGRLLFLLEKVKLQGRGLNEELAPLGDAGARGCGQRRRVGVGRAVGAALLLHNQLLSIPVHISVHISQSLAKGIGQRRKTYIFKNINVYNRNYMRSPVMLNAIITVTNLFLQIR